MKLIPGMIFKGKKSGLRKIIIDVSGEQIYIKDHNGVRFMMSAWDLENFNGFTGELEQELVPVGTKLIWTKRMGITSFPFIKEGHSFREDTGGLCIYMNKVGGYGRAEDVTLFLEKENENS